MPEIRIIESLSAISKASWDACFTEEIENYDYLLAIEKAGIAGFSFVYATAWENGVLLAAMPAFLTDYALDTTLQGTGKKITGAIAAAFPHLLKIKLACLGSPCTETGKAGFHRQVSAAEKPVLLQRALEEFERYARQHRCKLMGIKDIPETMDGLWKPALEALNYASLPAMPAAHLPIDFSTMDEYMARLSPATRKDMRRKLKSASAVAIHTVHALDDVLLQVMMLYRGTRSRSDWQFEELTADYFRGVLARMPGQSFCTLYSVQGRLLAANLLIHDQHTLVDKFFCMDSAMGRDYNLYFLSWFTNVRFCIEHGFSAYHSGQANYENKLRLGSSLTRTQMHFKHRNAFAHGLLKLAAPFLAADETVKKAA